eukprot:scaffold4447_cov120-Cylindrotheca_fusiformis.AAC.4
MDIKELEPPMKNGNKLYPTILVVLGALILTILGTFLLYVQCQRLSRLRHSTIEKAIEEGSTTTREFKYDFRDKHRQSYSELSAQLQEMQQVHRDVKGQLAGLQNLAAKLSEQQKQSTKSPLVQPSSKKTS